MKEQTVVLRDPLLSAFLAWLVPGGGHLYQGRTGKAILYAGCILGLYVMGMVMGEGKIVYWRWVNPFNNPEKFCIYYLGQFWVGLPALPALIQGTLQHFGHDPILGRVPGGAVADRLERPASSTRQAGRDRHDLHHRRRAAQYPGHLRRL